MCGICGLINFSRERVNEPEIKAMMKEIKHRGPNDEGIYLDDNIGLGFVRLSIIDLSLGGHQPMVSNDGNYILVFNGEIYNYVEIRHELKTKGYKFKTDSDSEVLLNSYIEWKEDCLNKFNGMWSFVVYDKNKKEIFAARDRYGIKPFYFYWDKNRFIFASEIKAILKVTGKLSPDYQNLYDYLVYNRSDHNNETFFKGIKKLGHGHKLLITNGSFLVTKWYDLGMNLKEPFKSPEQYLDMFTSSVNLRLRSDVPIGVCLSGGIDSSSIVSVLQKQGMNLNSFSAIYGSGKAGDESKYLDEYKGSNILMHFVKPDARAFFDDLDSFLNAHEEPVPSTSPYAQFKVMQLAKGKVIVTLDGQGADEQLAGYHYFYGQYFKDLLLGIKIKKLIDEQFKYFKNQKSIYGLKALLYYLSPAWLRKNITLNDKNFLSGNFISDYKDESTVDKYLYESKSLNDLLLNHFEYKLEHLLKWEDRNSMFFSIEARVPFLDFRLVERTIPMPSSDKIRDGNTKFMLREAMKDILPEKIRTRHDKIGFSTPQSDWFREEMFKKLFYELFNSQSFKDRGVFNPTYVIKSFNNHIKGEKDISKEIWKWVNTELWFRKYIDN